MTIEPSAHYDEHGRLRTPAEATAFYLAQKEARMNDTDTLELVLGTIENALYALAQEQNQEGNEVFSEWDVQRGDKAVHLYLDDGTVISIVAQQEAQ